MNGEIMNILKRHSKNNTVEILQIKPESILILLLVEKWKMRTWENGRGLIF